MAELAASTVLNNRYELEKMIGRGGFAVVWLARDQQADNEHMALKVYAPDKGLDDSSMQLFEQEYQLAQQLRDSRLLRATDYFHYGASPVLAFPYCSHGSALHYLQRNGPLPEEELARLIYQIGGALAYLHSRRPPVLHLDLKPDNILLSNSGDYLLADFGVSVRLQSSLLRGSDMKGATLDYLAPEHWTSGKLGAKADIFSLGVTLWELTTGRSPFPGQGGQFLLLGLPVPDIPTEDGYTKRLNRLVHRCLGADPEDRPSAKDLETWADSFLEDGYWPEALSSGGGEGASPQPPAAENPGGQPTARVTPGQEAGPQPEQDATTAGQVAPGAEAGQATHKLGQDPGAAAAEAPPAEPATPAQDQQAAPKKRPRWLLPLLLVLGVGLVTTVGIIGSQQGSNQEEEQAKTDTTSTAAADTTAGGTAAGTTATATTPTTDTTAQGQAAAGDGRDSPTKQNASAPAFGPQQVITTNAGEARSVYATDLDGDGDADVLSASYDDNKIAWYENQGGRFGSQQVITTNADAAQSVYATDLDGDGDADVLSNPGDKIAWYENQGGGRFGSQQVITTGADRPWSVYATDLDGDGDADVLWASIGDDKIAWHENQGGTFGNQQVISTKADGAYSVYATDLDGDSDADVLSASRLDDKIAWYENQGGGSFSPQQVITTNADAASSVYATDLDGDGDADVLSALYNDDKIAWNENHGGGSFGDLQVINTSANGAESVYATDLDGDGDADVLSASYYDNKIAWYENQGGGSFGAQQVISTNAVGAENVYATDLDGDGDTDVLSASYDDDKIAWYENQQAVP